MVIAGRSLARVGLSLAALALVLCLPVQAQAAIAFDASSSANGSSLIGTPFTFSHTTSGSNRALACVLSVNPAATITATYNSVSMTLVHTNATGASRVFYLNAPATGANTAAFTTDGDTAIFVACASYTGVSQTGQPVVAAEEDIVAMNTSNKHVVDITTSTTTWLVLATMGYVEDRTPTSDNATFRVSGVSGVVGLFDSNGDVTAGAVSRNWYYNTSTTSNAYAVIMALEPAGGGGGGATCSGGMLLRGVGGC